MSVGLIRSVAVDAGVSVQVATRISASAAKKYKIFRVPKRRGNELRTLAQPAREVKAVQRAIIRFLSPRLPIHEQATAYVEGGSILKNAQAHMDARFLLKLDFESFFPSISAAAIQQHLVRHIAGISDSEISFVISACLWRAPGSNVFGLCVGAPSSPFLSNTVMHDFDERAQAICVNNGATYTRYSDDITLSSGEKGVLSEVERNLRELVQMVTYPRLHLNEGKRVSVSRGAALRVTGLTLANQGFVSVGRERKRGVRAGVDSYFRGLLNADRVEELKGELAFVLDIEPGFLEVLFRKHGVRLGEIVSLKTIGRLIDGRLG